MSTQRPEDVSEAVVAPVAAVGESSHDADMLSPDDTNSVDGKATSAVAANSVGSTEGDVLESVEQDSANSPVTDFSQKLSENTKG
ncbi:hypothetical protein [cf. Phormidesmis sp. LEGE 11477]|uniref:hypothetical protein n=1 Tax=cf. Phormidesmis sp. LEGE 11477 TaxID=1828680 RepID=UPI001881FD61|nr:hypothetical protein [cf. Phormidesmis sp. LEGE 11477]MBE9061647.1 hypothetical protein [cf. Phormidesmis sp. LEGE 11477]